MNKRPSEARLATFAIALNPVLWGVFYCGTKSALVRFDPLVFAFLETVSIAPMAFAMVRARKEHVTLPHVLKGAALGALLGMAVMAAALAMGFTSATETALFPALNGPLAVLFSALVLRKRLPRMSWLAAALAALGATILIVGTQSGSPLGNLIALGAALIYGVYIFAVDRVAKDSTEPWIILGFEMLTMAAICLIGALAFGDWRGAISSTQSHLGLILLVGVGTTFVPAAIALWAQKHVNPINVAFLYALEPVWAALFARAFLAESIGASSYLGGALILLAAGINTASGERGI